MMKLVYIIMELAILILRDECGYQLTLYSRNMLE